MNNHFKKYIDIINTTFICFYIISAIVNKQITQLNLFAEELTKLHQWKIKHKILKFIKQIAFMINKHQKLKERNFVWENLLSIVLKMWNCHNTPKDFPTFPFSFSLFSHTASRTFSLTRRLHAWKGTSLFASSTWLCLTHLMTLNIFALGITQKLCSFTIEAGNNCHLTLLTLLRCHVELHENYKIRCCRRDILQNNYFYHLPVAQLTMTVKN